MSLGKVVWNSTFKNGTVRPKTYEKLSDKEKLQANCDLKATNIVLQGLPPDVYALVNHHKVAKDIWDRVKLLMQGTSLSKQERECKLYDEFDKFSYVKVKVNTKFLNSLSPEWGKFVTDVKLTRDLHTHTQPSITQNAYLPPIIPQQPQAEFPQIDSSLAVPTFLPGDDLIASTIQDGRVTVLQVQERQSQNVVSSGSQGNASGSRGNTSSQAKVIKCYNCQGKEHMARQCTQPKRRDATWFKEKVLLVQAQAEGKELDGEHLAFLANLGVTDAKAVLMANLSSCDLDVLYKVPYSDTSQNDMMNQSVHEFQYSELSPIIDYPYNEITSDSNIIPYSQYLEETQQAIVQNINTSA
ncbi:retrovirus-related pol polyprotein from transposon TNT 1-94 [Tanacetum coccineum]